MAQRAARIVRDNDVMGGEPRIEGRRVTVLRIKDLVEERRRLTNMSYSSNQ